MASKQRYWKVVKVVGGRFFSGGVGGSQTTQFVVGETVAVPGEASLCVRGIHFYKKENFCFGMNLWGTKNVAVLEVSPVSEVISDTEKCVSSCVKVVRVVPERTWRKQLSRKSNTGEANSGQANTGNLNSGLYNSGDKNSGNHNTGRFNSGDSNSGSRNSGRRNSGDANAGGYNSGSYNSGDENSGHGNSGRCNSGDDNSGNYNSGSYNSGNFNSGDFNSCDGYRNVFCTKKRFFLFDSEVTEKAFFDFYQGYNMDWFDLRGKTYKEAWAKVPEGILSLLRKKKALRSKKNRAIFEEITGIKL